MAYEYERWITHLMELRLATEGIDPEEETRAFDELKEVYAKAEAFDEIVIETTGAIMNCPPGVVETEVGKLTLDIIDKYEKQMEDK